MWSIHMGKKYGSCIPTVSEISIGDTPGGGGGG